MSDDLGYHGPRARDRLGRFKGMRDNPAMTELRELVAAADQVYVATNAASKRWRSLDQAVRAEALAEAMRWGLGYGASEPGYAEKAKDVRRLWSEGEHKMWWLPLFNIRAEFQRLWREQP